MQKRSFGGAGLAQRKKEQYNFAHLTLQAGVRKDAKAFYLEGMRHSVISWGKKPACRVKSENSGHSGNRVN